MSDKELIALQDRTFLAEDADPPIPPQDIVAYNELRSCADLYRMYKSGKLELKPDFQRDVVWKRDDQSRFIDSLVKQLPIPSMCFSVDYKTQKWKVIDGLQRMTAIVKFLGEELWELSDLSDIHPTLRKAINTTLEAGTPEQKRIYGMVQDLSVPITVIRCDYTQANHMRYLFTIFHRLNSGGVRLNNQEIRNCIYSGNFNELLKKVDSSNKDWQLIRKRIWGSMDRFRSVEVLLRILAFSEKLNEYDGNLAKFLNDYMHANSNINNHVLENTLRKIEKTINLANEILKTEPPGKLPLAKVEALLVGLYGNESHVNNLPNEELIEKFKILKQKNSFSIGVRFAVSSAENVKARLQDALTSFA